MLLIPSISGLVSKTQYDSIDKKILNNLKIKIAEIKNKIPIMNVYRDWKYNTSGLVIKT